MQYRSHHYVCQHILEIKNLRPCQQRYRPKVNVIESTHRDKKREFPVETPLARYVIVLFQRNTLHRGYFCPLSCKKTLGFRTLPSR